MAEKKTLLDQWRGMAYNEQTDKNALQKLLFFLIQFNSSESNGRIIAVSFPAKRIFINDKRKQLGFFGIFVIIDCHADKDLFCGLEILC